MYISTKGKVPVLNSFKQFLNTVLLTVTIVIDHSPKQEKNIRKNTPPTCIHVMYIYTCIYNFYMMLITFKTKSCHSHCKFLLLMGQYMHINYIYSLYICILLLYWHAIFFLEF